MKQAAYKHVVLFEHRFWLQILGDHSRFILNSLSPVEKTDTQEAHKYIKIFDQLLAQAREFCFFSQISELTEYAFDEAKGLRCFKLELLRRRLVDKIIISLPPTFFGHMINEEYIRILECLLAKQAPPLTHPIHHHLLWISDYRPRRHLSLPRRSDRG